MENKEDKRICRAKIIVPESGADYFEAVAVPFENGQMKYNGRNDEYFMQILKVNRENVKSDRLVSGLPIFDNHPWETSATNTLGITTDYLFDERGLVVRVKLGARADEALRSDIANGIIKTVSIEGNVLNYSVERKVGEIPKYYAELWEPESLSFAPVPQDISSQIDVKRKIERQLKGVETIEKSNISSIKSKLK
jgi:hypothetical protein